MKYYEIIEYQDGGPNDKGTIIAYAKGENEEDLSVKKHLTSGFISATEIPLSLFEDRKNKAIKHLAMFNIK